jgi:hypothetical protein
MLASVSGLPPSAAPARTAVLASACRRLTRHRSGIRRYVLRRFHVGEALVLTALGAAAISACGSSTVVAAKPSVTIHASLATSAETSAGAWASLPMGHLDEPLNTFWQLLFRPTGAGHWSDEASALAVATNGGLVVATSGTSLTVGIRPTNYLDYSPLVVTTQARSWSPAGPIQGLGDRPDSLAVDAGGSALALVGKPKVASVLESSKGLVAWHRLTSLRGLEETAAGRQCKLSSLSAVGFLGGQVLVGTTCRRRGVVGIFTRVGSAWALVEPQLSPALRHAELDVIGLEVVSGGLCALLGVTGQPRIGLVAQCTRGVDSSWRSSREVVLKGNDDTVSFGPTSRPGLFALISTPDGPSSLEALDSADMDWTALPSPPVGAVTAVFSPGGEVDALAVDDTLFTDWRLGAAGGTWKQAQRLEVPIQFGSSS